MTAVTHPYLDVAIHRPVRLGYGKKKIDCLIDCGRKRLLNDTYFTGQSVLHLAVTHCGIDIVSHILDLNAKLTSLSDVDGNLPIHFIRTKSNLEKLIRVDCESLDATNDQGASPLCSFIERTTSLGHNEICNNVQI